MGYVYDFAWDDQGDQGHWVRYQGRDVCVEAHLCVSDGHEEGTILCATGEHVMAEGELAPGDGVIVAGGRPAYGAAARRAWSARVEALRDGIPLDNGRGLGGADPDGSLLLWVPDAGEHLAAGPGGLLRCYLRDGLWRVERSGRTLAARRMREEACALAEGAAFAAEGCRSREQREDYAQEARLGPFYPLIPGASVPD